MRLVTLMPLIAFHLVVACGTSPSLNGGLDGGSTVDAGPVDAGSVCDGVMPVALPHLCTDRTALVFGQEFGASIVVGASASETLELRNGGKQTLAISAVVVTGDPAFALAYAFVPTQLSQGQTLAVAVKFSPTEAKAFAGTLLVESNADNGGDAGFALSGCGVSVGGASPCFRDGGR
jgi:hypothetical protein